MAMSSKALILNQYNNIYFNDSPLVQQRLLMLQSIIETEEDCQRPIKVQWQNDSALEEEYRKLFRLLRPGNAEGKVRIGDPKDGNCILLDPGYSGAAYSLALKPHAAWNLEMASRGFRVFQFDRTTEKTPEGEEREIFLCKNVMGVATHKDNDIEIGEFFSVFRQGNERNIILQMDIEGSEWDFFEAIGIEDLARFSQMIVKFHGLADRNELTRYARIFEKICESHAPIHFGYGSSDLILGFRDFIVSNDWEISFARKARSIFRNSNRINPASSAQQDREPVSGLHVGDFDILCGVVPRQQSPGLPAEI